MALILTPSSHRSISATIAMNKLPTTFYCCERTSKFPDLLILVWLNDDHLDSFRVSFLIYWLLDWLIDYMATWTVRYVSRLYLSATYAELHTSVTPIDEMTSVSRRRRKRIFHEERSSSDPMTNVRRVASLDWALPEKIRLNVSDLSTSVESHERGWDPRKLVPMVVREIAVSSGEWVHRLVAYSVCYFTN